MKILYQLSKILIKVCVEEECLTYVILREIQASSNANRYILYNIEEFQFLSSFSKYYFS